MAVQDELVYWNAMAALRKEEAALAVLPYVGGSIYECLTELCADRGWTCVEINVSPTKINLRGYIFPKTYFEFCQRYVATALSNKPLPGPGSTAKAKILWLLDVQAHVTYAWLALGIPYTWIQGKVASFGTSTFNPGWGLLNNWGGYQDSVPLDRPAPFYFSPMFLANKTQPFTPSGADDTFRGTSLLTKLINEVQPWLKDGFRLGSYKDADKATLSKANANDGPLARAIVQARMWSIIDYDWPKAFRTKKPIPTWNFGGTNTKVTSSLLTDYITNVSKYEGSTAAIIKRSGSGTDYQAYGNFPNLAWSFEKLPPDVDGLLHASFDKWLIEYANLWLLHAFPTPGKDPVVQGSLLISGEPSPISMTDFKLADLGELSVVQQMATGSFEPNPKTDAEKKAYEQYQKYKAKIEAFPGGKAFSDQGRKAAGQIAKLLFAVGGMARGVSQVPKFFRPIPIPFYRTLKDDAFRTIPEGPTTVAIARVVVAMQNIEQTARLGNAALKDAETAAIASIQDKAKTTAALVAKAAVAVDAKKAKCQTIIANGIPAYERSFLTVADIEFLVTACVEETVSKTKPQGHMSKVAKALVQQRQAEALYSKGFWKGLFPWMGAANASAAIKQRKD